ncbi:predicted protein [Lichtheimia corymbifera JMRC:FSU:9682]|uniref:Uncharacterized protein n=1 Tax=Lichtheimia corymbifera JMRC:FSU:9682 TaxID=1263082 RepID=A0A068SDH4_9FUNG|nr:predicted protein [Lichtheimia corymbifera JMRC:FSU:9682]
MIDNDNDNEIQKEACRISCVVLEYWVTWRLTIVVDYGLQRTTEEDDGGKVARTLDDIKNGLFITIRT